METWIYVAMMIALIGGAMYVSIKYPSPDIYDGYLGLPPGHWKDTPPSDNPTGCSGKCSSVPRDTTAN